VDPKLLESLVCPRCHGALQFEAAAEQPPQALLCTTDQLRYPIEAGIPVLLLAKASSYSWDYLA
jgi:uncharacterized protein YbaR (Trm112 family)